MDGGLLGRAVVVAGNVEVQRDEEPEAREVDVQERCVCLCKCVRERVCWLIRGLPSLPQSGHTQPHTGTHTERHTRTGAHAKVPPADEHLDQRHQPGARLHHHHLPHLCVRARVLNAHVVS